MMTKRSFLGGLAVAALSLPSTAQELPSSGVSGYWFFHASSPGRSSRFLGVNLDRSPAPIQFGPEVQAVPSRWAHRRRTLGALETLVVSPEPRLWITPMGDAVGNGAIHFVDRRGGVAVNALVPTANPAGYDLAVLADIQCVFAAEDDGSGGTVLRGWSYATPGAPLALSPLTLAGSPAAHVNRMGVDEAAHELHVPTALGVFVVQVSGTQMVVATSHVTAPFVPATNPSRFELGGQATWVIGTSTFDAGGTHLEAGALAWTSTAVLGYDGFGVVPSDPTKNWIPAAGTTELAVVDDGTDAYAYFLLREPPPGTFFIKPSAIGVVRFVGGAAPALSTILMPDEVGEPFAIPTVSATRVAFESSFGPPFIYSPPGGGEKISVVYTPLDPLGAGSVEGVLGVPGPLGGRISTKGMDRPLWSADGTRVMAATSHFPGAPNPGRPGLEVLEVPAAIPLDQFTTPHTVLHGDPSPNQSIVFPSVFRPRAPGLASALAGLDFYGNVFHKGLASLSVAAFGELGQLQLVQGGIVQSPNVPNFPGILPPSFDDPQGATPIPGDFGARRTSFTLGGARGLEDLRMIAADGDRLLIQHTGRGLLAALGLAPPSPAVEMFLPPGWMVTTEFNAF